MGKSALYLWCIGLALITFDLILTFEIGGFTIKSYYFFFLASAMLLAIAEIRADHLWKSAKLLLRPPWIFAFLLFVYELGMSPFSFVPKKSFAYSSWLLFDLAVVALPGYLLIGREGEMGRRMVTRTLLFSAFFLVSILLIDLVAFQYGYIGGLIGFNQELSLLWGMSRAHAFAYEPSYLSLFFTFSLLFLLGQSLSSRVFAPRALLVAASFALLIGIFLLGSRTGWALTAIGVFALFAGLGRKLLRRNFLLTGGTALLLFGLFLWILPAKQFIAMKQNLVSTLMAGTDGSSNTRVAAMVEGVRTGIDTHGLGVGVGASFFYYISRHPEVVTPQLNVSMGSENIMSIWGQIVAESGFPGLLLYAGFGLGMIYIIFRAVRARFEASSLSLLISSFLFFTLAAHLVGNVARTDVWIWFAIWMAFTQGMEDRQNV